MKLSDFSMLNSEEWEFCFSKLEDVLLGFKYLYQKYGPFRIMSDQIGWTANRLTKVWLHKNFWSNEKDNKGASEYSMVKDIFNCFSQALGIKFVQPGPKTFQ